LVTCTCDYTNDSGSYNTTTVAGWQDSSTVQGTGDTTNITGSGSDNTLVTGTSDYTNDSGSYNTTTVAGWQDSSTVQGTGDTTNITGSGNDNTDVTGLSDGTSVAGNYDTTVIGGREDSTGIKGTGDTTDVTGSGGDTTRAAGTDDYTTVTGNSDATDSTGSGDVYNGDGSGDTTGAANGSGGYSTYGGYYGGFVGNPLQSASGIDKIAQYDAAHDYTQAGAATEAVLGQAVASADGTLTTSAATLAADPTSPEWASQTITWSFASGLDTGTTAVPFSGAVGTDYQPIIESALQTWAVAGGFTFQEVPNSTSADIKIGWGDFDTADSNLIGLTSLQTSDGIIQPGALARMEDPAQTALIDNAAGQPTYADTGATLYQVALHEIGHALGLSDNSDPNSVMYYSLGANNPTLDATDVAAIEQLYGAGASGSAGTNALLRQAMASFGTQAGSSPLAPTAAMPVQDAVLVSNAMH
jgi:predicted Zn-dependent protease